MEDKQIQESVDESNRFITLSPEDDYSLNGDMAALNLE